MDRVLRAAAHHAQQLWSGRALWTVPVAELQLPCQWLPCHCAGALVVDAGLRSAWFRYLSSGSLHPGLVYLCGLFRRRVHPTGAALFRCPRITLLPGSSPRPLLLAARTWASGPQLPWTPQLHPQAADLVLAPWCAAQWVPFCLNPSRRAAGRPPQRRFSRPHRPSGGPAFGWCSLRRCRSMPLAGLATCTAVGCCKIVHRRRVLQVLAAGERCGS